MSGERPVEDFNIPWISFKLVDSGDKSPLFSTKKWAGLHSVGALIHSIPRLINKKDE